MNHLAKTEPFYHYVQCFKFFWTRCLSDALNPHPSLIKTSQADQYNRRHSLPYLGLKGEYMFTPKKFNSVFVWKFQTEKYQKFLVFRKPVFRSLPKLNQKGEKKIWCLNSCAASILTSNQLFSSHIKEIVYLQQ